MSDVRKATIVVVAGLVVVGLVAGGCSMLSLNGCRRVAACRSHVAYACGYETVCADQDGRPVRYDSTGSVADACHLCDVQE